MGSAFFSDEWLALALSNIGILRSDDGQLRFCFETGRQSRPASLCIDRAASGNQSL